VARGQLAQIPGYDSETKTQLVEGTPGTRGYAWGCGEWSTGVVEGLGLRRTSPGNDEKREVNKAPALGRASPGRVWGEAEGRTALRGEPGGTAERRKGLKDLGGV
jgi:hypothetical protein